MGGLGSGQHTCPPSCHRDVAMAAAAPTEADLAAKAGGLKSTETKEGGAAAADPAVVALYEKTWDDHNGDKDAICAALGLDPATQWNDPADKADFIKKRLG